MRSALTVACQAVGYTPKEVFPKQTRVTGTGLGNYVRLPFNGFCAEGDHTPRVFVDTDKVFGSFLLDMDEQRASTSVLEDIASLAALPQGVDVSVDYEVDADLDPIVRSLPGLAFRIWRDGPLGGNDRSTTLVYLARVMADRGISPQDAFAVLAHADKRWGKQFLDRGSGR